VPRGPSALISVTMNLAPGKPILQFSQVVCRDLIQRKIHFRGNLCQIPQYIAQLGLYGKYVSSIHHAALVPEDLLNLAGHLPRLIRQTQRRVNDGLAYDRVPGSGSGLLLIVS